MTFAEVVIFAMIVLLALAIGSIGRRVETIEATLVECAEDLDRDDDPSNLMRGG